jgi:hypothetical protein
MMPNDDLGDRHAPAKKVTLDPREFAKCSPAEQFDCLRDLQRLESRGYFGRVSPPTLAWACIDFSEYDSPSEFVAKCRQIHKGNAVRDAVKATRLGYYSKFFDFRTHIPDVVAINRSTPVRQGRPMAPHSQRSVEDYGGYPTSARAEAIPTQQAFWSRFFGLYRKKPGHRQGEVVTDEELLAYIELRRFGDFAMNSLIIGNADYLKDGIMYRMQMDLVGAILEARRSPAQSLPHWQHGLATIQYLGYADYFGIQPGLQIWKKRMLFEPIYLWFDYVDSLTPEQLYAVAKQARSNTQWLLQCARMLADLAYGKAAQNGQVADARAKALAILDEAAGREPANTGLRGQLDAERQRLIAI